MSRRLTGWVLTAAVIAALPAPALSSNDPIANPGQDFRPTVAPVGSEKKQDAAGPQTPLSPRRKPGSIFQRPVVMDPGFRRGDTGGGDIGEGSFIPRGSTQSVETLRPSHEGIQPLAGSDGDYTNCLEVTPVQQPQGGLPAMAVAKGPPVDIYMRDHSTTGIAGEIARAKRGAADQTAPGPLLIDRNLPPNGTTRPDQIKAACGIPRGLTLFAPPAPGRGRGA